MKKLMIVAAIAAMVGGVKADDYVYDFTASLTTTSGKEGKDIKTTHYVGLGRDATGAWWYNDKVFSAEYTVGKKKFKDFAYTYTESGKTVYVYIPQALKYGSKLYPWKLNTAVVKTDEDKAIIAQALGWTAYDPYTKDPAPRSVTGYTNYDEQQMYKNKPVWCEKFSFKVTTDADCYRDTAKLTIKGYVMSNAICIDDSPATLVESSNGDVYDFNYKFVNFFGSQVPEKATKVEALFDISDGNDIDGADGTNLYFALAGQGKYSNKLKDSENDDGEGINNISGNIVGYLPAPTCEACCDDPLSAIAFLCAFDSLTPAYDLPTAAYGTWSMKFNKKLSDFL